MTPVYYHQVAIDVPLYRLFTYQSATLLAPGTRVLVSFRGKTVCGLVWAHTDTLDVAAHKILPIQSVLADALPLSDDWRALMDFCARYYHHPLGQTVFTALPSGLKQHQAAILRPSERYFALSAPGQDATAPPASHARKHALWQALAAGPTPLSQLKKHHPQAQKNIDDWAEAGWIVEHDGPSGRVLPSDHVLNPEQQQAVDLVSARLGTFAPYLLFGITGSGKTEVYFQVIATALARGQQVLFLLPEINLTPQLLTRIQARFEHVGCVVLHSQTAASERTQNYLAAQSGRAQLIIGTRLSVFTPLPKLGLIVVDEEHDGSFKQDNDLRYQARDLAVWRAKQSGCPIILGSATPSLESWQHAKAGHYQLLTLSQRAHTAATLPEVLIEDVGRQFLDNGFSKKTLAALKKNHQDGGLSLVYLNRRGFAPALMCTDCGHSFGCPMCSAKMVFHRLAHHLRCHHCNHVEPVPTACPECGNQDLTAVGQGTQRVEETLQQALPKARIKRVDRDSTSKKNDWDILYQQIHNQEVDVLVGTQMLSKGHDFGRLNLVVVMNADGGLYSPDFRASEHMFSELAQVAGRSGRADSKGQVLIQTQVPDHPVFQALKAHDYVRFADEELANRKLFGFSPFQHSIAIKADAPLIHEAIKFLTELKAQLDAPDSVFIMGPAPAFMVRLAGRERAQLFIEGPKRSALHQVAATAESLLPLLAKPYKDLRWSIDVDPLAY
ncbi:MAG: primosomal protein N' [Neisseriaceae bacterium]|nr:primosomal protein N' [Neisseriaceae bacterium]